VLLAPTALTTWRRQQTATSLQVGCWRGSTVFVRPDLSRDVGGIGAGGNGLSSTRFYLGPDQRGPGDTEPAHSPAQASTRTATQVCQ